MVKIFSQTAAGLNFGDKTIRRGFIRKVYSILSLQLVLTGGMIAYFVFLLPQQYQSPICREAETQYYKNNYHVSAAEDDTGYVEDNNTKTFDIDRCNKM